MLAFIVALLLGGTSVCSAMSIALDPGVGGRTEKPDAPIHSAVIVNPIGPLVGLLATGVGFPTLSLNARYHRPVGDGWTLTVIPELLVANIFVEFTMLGAKVGPRLDLSRPGLAGWYVLPFGLAGYGWSHNARGTQLASGAIFGLGAEGGYCWHWGALVVELGGGLYTATTIGEGKSQLARALPGLRPSLNLSIGYGF